MPQVDNVLFLGVIYSLSKCCVIFYGFFLVYLFYPFISHIKVVYNFLSKLIQVKVLLTCFFKKTS